MAIVAKVQTLADNGLRVYLDLPEQAIEAVAELMIYKRAGVVLNMTAIPTQNKPQAEQENDTGTVSRTKAKKRVGAGDSGV